MNTHFHEDANTLFDVTGTSCSRGVKSSAAFPLYFPHIPDVISLSKIEGVILMRSIQLEPY